MTVALLGRLALLLVVVVLVVWRPRNLHVAVPAVGGALVAALLGWVGRTEVTRVFALVWNATATLIGLMLISSLLDKNGAFRYAAMGVARASGGNGRRLFVALCLLATVSTAILANDGAILLVTPMLLELGRLLALPTATTFAYLFATGFLIDALSTPLVSSNLTNILLADGLQLPLGVFASRMLAPTLAMLPVAIATTALVVRRDLPARIDLAPLARAPERRFRRRSRVATTLALGAFIALCILGHSWRIPLGLGVLAIGGALLVVEWLIGTVRPLPIVIGLPWGIVVFSSGLFLVVMAAAEAGLAPWLGHALVATGRLGGGLLVGLAASIFNNLPVLLLAMLGLQTQGAYDPSLPYAALIGANVGSKLFPMGSLATLLWLEVLREGGLQPGWGRYIVLAALPTIATLLAGLAVLSALRAA